MKLDAHELTNDELKFIYGGNGGDDGSGNSGVPILDGGILNDNNLGLGVNLVGGTNAYAPPTYGRGGDDDD